MEEKLISLETAKLAKEKGFDWPVRFCYDKCEMLATYVPGEDKNYNNSAYCCNAAQQSLLQKWLRDVKKQDIEITTAGLSGNYYCFVPQTGWGYIYEGSEIKEFPSYEEALEAGLLESLKLV